MGGNDSCGGGYHTFGRNSKGLGALRIPAFSVWPFVSEDVLTSPTPMNLTVMAIVDMHKN